MNTAAGLLLSRARRISRTLDRPRVLDCFEMGLVRFAVKSSILGGVVYYTVKEGLWANSETSCKLYGKIYNNVAPLIKDNVPKQVVDEMPPIPRIADISFYIKSKWNAGLLTSTSFLAHLPTHTCNAIDYLRKKSDGLFNSPKKPEKSQDIQ